MTTTLTATLIARSTTDALARAAKHVAKVDGFELTGNVSERSSRRLLHDVEILNTGGDVNDLWVVLTSFGIDPSKDLGSVWQSVEGLGA